MCSRTSHTGKFGRVCLTAQTMTSKVTDASPVMSVVDPEAEPSGFEFDGSGVVAYMHLQHGECPDDLKDFRTNPDNGCTNDLIKITGFQLPLGFSVKPELHSRVCFRCIRTGSPGTGIR